MTREISIDKSIYAVDDASKTYRFVRRNPDWAKTGEQENRKNKQSIDGYTRIFRDGTRKKFIRSDHPE